MMLAYGAKPLLENRLAGLKPADEVYLIAGYSPPYPFHAIEWTPGCDWRVLKGLDVMIHARNLNRAAEATLDVIPEAGKVEIFDDESLKGFTARIRLLDKRTDLMTEAEIRRDWRRLHCPQGTDVVLVPWPASMYFGMGNKSWPK